MILAPLIGAAMVIEPLWLAQVCPWRPGMILLTALMPGAAVLALWGMASAGRTGSPALTRETVGVSG